MVANRILTTHVGSLVRPPKLVEFLHKIEDRQPYDQTAYEACLKASIEQVVQQQVDAGIDIVSDGEFSKGRNWAFYVHDRLSGLTSRPATPEEMKDPMSSAGGGQDHVAFPEFYAEYDRASGLGARTWWMCTPAVSADSGWDPSLSRISRYRSMSVRDSMNRFACTSP